MKALFVILSAVLVSGALTVGCRSRNVERDRAAAPPPPAALAAPATSETPPAVSTPVADNLGASSSGLGL